MKEIGKEVKFTSRAIVRVLLPWKDNVPDWLFSSSFSIKSM